MSENEVDFMVKAMSIIIGIIGGIAIASLIVGVF